MRTGINHLFIPGPTNVRESVRQAMKMPMQDHRAPDFGAPNPGLFRDLKWLFGTETGHVMLFPGSGTGAGEAAITNTLSPGDRVLMARHGQFSLLWAQMCLTAIALAELCLAAAGVSLTFVSGGAAALAVYATPAAHAQQAAA